MDALIVVNLILNIFVLSGLGFVVFILNKKIAEDSQKMKNMSESLARLDKHFKIGEQLFAKKLSENEARIKQSQIKQTELMANQVDVVKEGVEQVLSEVKALSEYEELK